MSTSQAKNANISNPPYFYRVLFLAKIYVLVPDFFAFLSPGDSILPPINTEKIGR
jgi:hypothetical protein